MQWNTLRTINTPQFAVSLQCTYEESPDSSWWDDETRDQITRGVYGVYVFRVVVFWRGIEIGADYLGDSVYENPRDFATEHRAGASYFSDMLRAAILDARRVLRNPPRVRHCDPAID